MDGSRREQQPPLELRREFAGSRLEEQIMVRAFELTVPIIRMVAEDEGSISHWDNGQSDITLSQGVEIS
jgi:hypothetical protein